MMSSSALKSLSLSELNELYRLKRTQKILAARNDFWAFCQVKQPTFYIDGREYLKEYCRVLQALFEGALIRPDGKPYNKLMINMPPQFGKSRTLQFFSTWCFGKVITTKILLASYNDTISGEFSKYTRDIISEPRVDEYSILYSDIFPHVRIKEGTASAQRWAVEGQFFSYLGCGVNGTVTGKGADIRLIDDPIKNAAEAYNEDALDKIWKWRGGTWLSRKAGRVIDIINMTRWAKKDVCGQIQDTKQIKDWYQLVYEAKDKDGVMLCSDILNEEEYNELADPEVGMDNAIFRANYHQEPIDIVGKLYTSYKTYAETPTDEDGNCVFSAIIDYTDTADEGNDYLCSIVCGEYQGEGYILDVYYTKDGMEVTEPATAEFLSRNNVNRTKIESNNGGRGFARNVVRLLSEQIAAEDARVNSDENFTDEDRTWSNVGIKWFHQSENKRARILSSSSFVMQHFYFPANWKDRWPLFYKAVTGYMREGKNSHDDAPDTLTGLAEMINRSRPRASTT